MIRSISTWFLLLLTLYACGDSNPNKPVNPIQPEILRISNDITLTDNVQNKRYIITSPGITVDLNGKSITGNGDYIFLQVNASNVTIKNGTIQSEGFNTGVHITSCIRLEDVQPLNIQGFSYESVIHQRCSKNVTVQNILFKNLKTGVYVGDYTHKHTIQHNRFLDIDRMGVYLSPAVKEVRILNNHFVDNGYRAIEDFGRPRGSISFDSAYNNIIESNYFRSEPKFVRRSFANDYRVPELEFYRNCGEPTFGNTPLPRLHGADNNYISNNTFENVGLVAWFKYRSHHQLSNCVGNYPDQANNNSVVGSTLINIKEFVIDNGLNNTW